MEQLELLSDRKAKCSSCGKIVPTSDKLAFLEETGEGTKAATNSCGNCGYYEIAHVPEKKNKFICDNFVPHGPWEYDRFYCGCRGWD